MLDISIPRNVQSEANIQSGFQLKSALVRNNFTKSDLNCEKVREKSEIAGKRIVLLVCDCLGIPPQLLMHHSRCRAHIADARQLAMYLLHVGAGFSMSEVGRFFDRDRTTVSHACNKIEDRRDCVEFDALVCALEENLSLSSLENYESLRL